MGFSKGCAVLNQFLYELHYYDRDSNTDPNINNFIKLIKDMWWLDGGHNGPKNTWITDKDILRSFAKLSKMTWKYLKVMIFRYNDILFRSNA